MTFTPIPAGTPQWDVPVNEAFVDQDARITATEAALATNNAALEQLRASGGLPQDYGLLSWSYDPATAAASVTPASGTVIMTKLWLNPGIVSALGVSINTPGVTLTTGQNYMGLYSVTGQRLAITADQTTNWASGGYQQPALLTPVTIPQGAFYYAAFLSNGATAATLTRGSNNSAAPSNLNLPAATARFTNGPTGQTSLPASIVMSSRTPTSQSYWMAAA